MKKILLAVVILLAGFVLWQWITFPDVGELAKKPPETTAFMELRKKQLRREGKSDKLSWKWVSYSKISPNLRRAVLVAEDSSFYEHEGVDVEGMKEALRKDWEKRRITHGGSTITQQLAKNLYLSPSRNPWRKVKEYLIARSLEEKLTKKRILEIYLNVVEFGERTYGAEAAARHFFSKGAASLSPREAALLAGCLPNPRVMRVDEPNKRLRARQRMILSRMRRWGYVLEREVLTERKKAEPAPETSTATETAAIDTAAPAETETTDSDLTPPDAEDTTTETAETTTVEPPADEPATEPAPPTTTATETTPPP